MCALDRITLHVESWFTVSTSVLPETRSGRILPAAATPQTVSMLGDADVDTGEAVSGLTTSTLPYHLLSYWLPIPLGGVGYVLFRRRHPADGSRRRTRRHESSRTHSFL